MSIRLARLERTVANTLSALVPARIRDPRAHAAEAITITKLKLAPDLTLARVLVSIKATEEVQKSVLAALKGATGFLRRELGQRVQMRRVPELVFMLDKTAESAARIEGILHELAMERAASGAELEEEQLEEGQLEEGQLEEGQLEEGQLEEGQLEEGQAKETLSEGAAAELDSQGEAETSLAGPPGESPPAESEPESAREGLESER